MIVSAIALAFGQLPDRRLQKVIWTSLFLTVLALFCLFYATGFVIAWAFPNGIGLPFLGQIDASSLGLGARLIAALILSVFLMVPIAQGVQSLLLDQVADAVEARHYPNLPPEKHIPWATLLLESGQALMLLLLANIAALLLYLLFPPFAPLLFYGINGLLLGREYFRVCALRREERPYIRQLQQRHFGVIWGAGILMAFGLTVPLLNLLVPVIGAATFTHIYHRIGT